MCGGLVVAFFYHYFLTHQQAIYILGTSACIVYIFEQVRTSYPEYADKFEFIMKNLFRAEERLKESAGVPYAMALLLTILSFPKPIALVGIMTLAISDPLSAIVGITKGKHKWGKGKSVEGSAAFFLSSFLINWGVLSVFAEATVGKIVGISLLGSLLISAFELIPLRLDDNLTLPLVSAFSLWILCGLFGIGFLTI